MRSLGLAVFIALIAAAGCTDTTGRPAGGGDASFAPAEATLHRLTRPQLQNAWLDLLGEPIELPTDLPADDVLYGLSSIAAARSTISPVDAEKYETATYQLLDQI